MKLTHFLIHPALRGHIEKIWVFESPGQMRTADLRVIVPNGLVKIVIPFHNALKATLAEKEIISPTHEITMIGIADIPSVVVDQFDGPSGTIGIEFNPAGAYRFFKLPLAEIQNQVLPLSIALGKAAIALQDKTANAPNISEKVAIVQRFLLGRFTECTSDAIFEYAVRKIISSKGRMLITQLEKQTGYSSRWLNMKFQKRIGISPKNLCSIVRFQQIYNGWAQSNFTSFERIDLYDYYHDQAHFIKDFKRFTGYSPCRFQSHDNDFGRIFYKG